MEAGAEAICRTYNGVAPGGALDDSELLLPGRTMPRLPFHDLSDDDDAVARAFAGCSLIVRGRRPRHTRASYGRWSHSSSFRRRLVYFLGGSPRKIC